MSETTTRPIVIPRPRGVGSGPGPGLPGAVRRIRVTRRSLVRTHRARRGVALPSMGRGDHYLVRVCRPAGQVAPLPLRAPVMTSHRVRVAS